MASNEPYMSEIKMVAFNFPPKGWALCNGQILPIAQNQALFSLLGTVYGGDGITNFKLPNLQGRVPNHFGQGNGLSPYALGQQGGSESQALSIAQIPQHTHGLSANTTVAASSNGATPAAGNSLGQSTAVKSDGGIIATTIYNSTLASGTTLASQSVANAGASQPHENRQPFQVVNFCIALQGIYPSRS